MTSRKRSPQPRYWKFQSKFVWLPAAIEGHRGDCIVAVRIHPSRRPGDKTVVPAEIMLDPHEAIGFAAWLNEQAEHIIAKRAKAAERAAAKKAARPGI